MSVSVLERKTQDTRLSKNARQILRAYAEMVWEIPEAILVYGFMADESLEIYTVGARFDRDARYRLYAIEHEVEFRYPASEIDFHIRNQKTMPHDVPNLDRDEVYVLARPQNL